MPKDISKFDNERQEVLNKMFNILGINENNNHFELKKLNNNIEMQNKILELENDIKKYFNYSQWECFKGDVKKRHMSFIRYILKNTNYKLTSNRKTIKDGDKTYVDTVYYIIKS